MDGETVVDDLVKGRVVFQNAELDDLIILRTDGTPTYNFCVVVDDAEMRITHVIRGDDHLANTPQQILIYQALGYAPARLRPRAADPRPRQGAAQQAPRRHVGHWPIATSGFLPDGARQLPRPPRLVARRPGDLHAATS